MGNTPINTNGVYVTCRMALNDVTEIDKLVQENKYLNRSDVIRNAVKQFLSTQ